MSAESLEDARPEGANPEPDRAVVTAGVVAVLAVVAWAAPGKDSFDTASSTALARVLANFAWPFVIAADAFLVMCVVLAISRFGRIRLGADDSEPEFTNRLRPADGGGARGRPARQGHRPARRLRDRLRHGDQPRPRSAPGRRRPPHHGRHRGGVEWLGTINIVLAAALMTFVFLLGPTVHILDVIPAGVGSSYLHTSRGSLDPPTWLVVTWGVPMAAAPAVLLVAGGLKSPQTATIPRSREPGGRGRWVGWRRDHHG